MDNVMAFLLLVAVIATILIIKNKNKSKKKIQEVLASPLQTAPSLQTEDLWPGEVSMIDEQDTPIFDVLTSCYDLGYKLEELPDDEIAIYNTPVRNSDDKKFIDAMIRTLKARDIKPVNVDDFKMDPDEVCYSEGVAKIYDAFDQTPSQFAKYCENSKLFLTEGKNFRILKDDQLKLAGDGKFYVTTKNVVIKIGDAVLKYPLSDIAAYSAHSLSGLLFNKKDGSSFVVDFIHDGHFLTFGHRNVVIFCDEKFPTLFALDKVF